MRVHNIYKKRAKKNKGTPKARPDYNKVLGNSEEAKIMRQALENQMDVNMQAIGEEVEWKQIVDISHNVALEVLGPVEKATPVAMDTRP